MHLSRLSVLVVFALPSLLSHLACDAADDASAQPDGSDADTGETSTSSGHGSESDDGDDTAAATSDAGMSSTGASSTVSTSADADDTSSADTSSIGSATSTSTSGDDANDGGDTTGGGETESSDAESSDAESSDAESSDAESSDAESSDAESSTGSPVDDGLPLHEAFTGDGGPWPAPWNAVGGAVLAADLVDDRARLSGAMGVVARMVLPGYEVVDLDATVIVEFDDPTRQGIGFYARQNGGVLHETVPPGQGYCVYVEGEGEPNLGIWREFGGVEQILAGVPDPIAGGIQSGTAYALRLQIVQAGAMTSLRTKMWRADEAEPAAWALEIEDGTFELQGTAGSFAVDIYNYDGTGSVYFDDIVVTAP